jgi:geranylgeranyl diphosphate synthase type I
VVATYRRFGWSLGLAFQLNDDLLGIWGDAASTGKEASDIATGKKTLPLIYARQEARGVDAERLRAILARSDADVASAEVEEARGILERVGAREYTRARARGHRDEALAELAALGFVDGEGLERLTSIARAAISA